MILLWILAIMLFSFFRNYGADLAAVENTIRGLNARQLFFAGIPVGAFAGIVYATVELVFDRPYFQRHSYGWIIMGKLIIFFFTVKIMMAIWVRIGTAFTGMFMERAEIIQIQSHHLGEELLKGKTKGVTIYGVTKK